MGWGTTRGVGGYLNFHLTCVKKNPSQMTRVLSHIHHPHGHSLWRILYNKPSLILPAVPCASWCASRLPLPVLEASLPKITRPKLVPTPRRRLHPSLAPKGSTSGNSGLCIMVARILGNHGELSSLPRGHIKCSACAVQPFGRLAVVETHTSWHFGHHCCLIVTHG